MKLKKTFWEVFLDVLLKKTLGENLIKYNVKQVDTVRTWSLSQSPGHGVSICTQHEVMEVVTSVRNGLGP